MARVPVDEKKVASCRALAAEVADDVQRYIDKHTSVGVERTILRALGAEGTDDQGAPLVNIAVERYQKAGLLGHGISYFLARALLSGATSVQDAAERIAFSPEIDRGEGGPSIEAVRAALDPHVKAALARIDDARDQRVALKAKISAGPTPHKYVIVATGNIYDDAVQAKAAAFAGADVIAVIRATAQSLLDYVERLDMLLNDAMYGILFRDINMCRTFVDQYVSRRFIARAKIVINTGEDNYLTTADAVEKAHTVLASQFINEAFALRAGLFEDQLGLGHAYEIDPWIEDSFLLELAQAQLVRQIFDKHPIKWMPPTKHKTGDIFQSHVHDAMFNLVGITTNQSIELLGMFSEAVHNPMLMDRYLSLKATRYVFNAAKHFGEEIEFKPGGRIAQRAVQVLDEAHKQLEEVKRDGIWDAIGKGAFADVKRKRDGGKGYLGVVERNADYVNPLLEALER